MRLKTSIHLNPLINIVVFLCIYLRVGGYRSVGVYLEIYREGTAGLKNIEFYFRRKILIYTLNLRLFEIHGLVFFQHILSFARVDLMRKMKNGRLKI